MKRKPFVNRFITFFVIVSTLVSISVLPAYATASRQSPLPNPTPTPSIITPTETLLPGICSAYVKPDFTIVSPIVLKDFLVVGGSGARMLTNDQGRFFLPNYTNSLNRFDISKAGYITRTINIPICDSKKPIDMWAGDLNGDNCINMSDIMIMASCFNTISGNEKYNGVCDFNKDDAVNLTDVLIAAKHYNKSSQDYPEYSVW